MSNIASLKPFKKGEDKRRNTTGENKGSLSMTKLIKEFLMETAKDGEPHAKKLTRAMVFRAIAKSDVLVKEIMSRIDGNVPLEIDNPAQVQAIKSLENIIKEIRK